MPPNPLVVGTPHKAVSVGQEREGNVVGIHIMVL